MGRMLKLLFSTEPRFGLVVGCIGCTTMLLVMPQTMLDAEPPHELLMIGNIMFWSGFAWAALTAFLAPFPVRGLGIGFAILFFLVVPGASKTSATIALDLWEYMLWVTMCLIILVVVMINLYRTERNHADELRKLYHGELERTGRSHPEPHVPCPKSGPPL